MFKIETDGGLHYGRFEEMNGPGVLSAFSLKSGPDDKINLALHTGDSAEKVLGDRSRFLSALGLDPARLSSVNQVHGDSVAVISENEAGRGAFDHKTTIEADALLTTARNISLVIFTADCVPVFLYDPSIPMAGLVHAGWQGVHKRILTKTVRMAVDRFGSNPANLRVGFGPFIRQCCYEVSADFVKNFKSQHFTMQKYRFFFDLSGPLREELDILGVGKQNIFDSGLCTRSSPDLCHSYRRDKTAFRHGTLICLK